ncbi:MAG TPA: amino acid adenylation domain-containing protein [Labilithrix sp.]|nr:amino acid adenylation domain-containing protein [Labilithrix sp.]
MELGEVESQVHLLPGVLDGVVIVRDDGGERRLVAYVVAKPNMRPSTAELRKGLAMALPDYMIPAAFVWLEALPRTPNGKIDRRALPAPEFERSTMGTEYVPPRSSTEHVLAKTWAEVLSVASVGIDDNFFHLGGHSLFAAQAAARAQATLGVDLPLRLIFRHPTIRELASVVDGLGAGDAFERIEPTPCDEELALSFGQQRLWFLDQYEGQGPTYNIVASFWLRGELDVDALGAAFGELVRRHEALRTRIVARDGRPVQVIDPPGPWPLPATDLRGEDAEARAVKRATELAETPFDLARGPLVRTELVRVADDAWLFVVGMHHIVSDGWSMGIAFRELRALYAAARSAKNAELPAPIVRYADFAAWQRHRLSEARLERHLAYWRDKLADVPVLELPVDRPRPKLMTNAGAHVPLAIPAGLTRALKDVARRADATLFMTLLAGFQALLGRYSGQADVAVGSPVAGRSRPELEGVIGFFVNTLVLRTDLGGDPSFLSLVRRVKTATLEAFDHQDVPFEKLVDALVTERDTSRTPLFQVMFSLENAGESFELPGVTTTQVPLPLRSAKFELSLDLKERGDEIVGLLEYNTDIFDRATAQRLAAHFVSLLGAAVREPEQSVHELSILLPEEQNQLLVAWNDTDADIPRDVCIHELFEEQAKKRPDAIALVVDDASLTYAELDARANALAHVLVDAGVGLEARVGLSAERSFDLIVGMLGILKAGGAYVPLETGQPEERMRFILENAQIRVVVALESHAKGLGLPPGITLVSPRQAPAGEVRRERRGKPEALAHVMYTSGSTGTPKGACLTHRNVAHISKGQSYVDLGSEQVWAHYATSSFDATTLEVWPALLNGARVVLFPSGTFDLDDFADRLKRFAVTTVWITAGLFRRIVEARLDALAGVRQIMTGGDVVSPWHVRALLEAYPDVRLINGYGPTENTVFASFFPIIPETPFDTEVPIGKLVRNCKAYVLNDALVPVPVGVAGQLYVAGEGLGRGYLDPQMTAERWVPNPFSREPGARMYRTGDLVRWRADGNLLFVGRIDGQVKVRGLRIELGEIEAAILRSSNVRATVVIVREDRPGDKRIVAYVVADAQVTAESLRAELASRLVPYMMPSSIVMLEQLPLTPRGKVDRRALPSPDTVKKEGGEELVVPRTQAESVLVEVWREVLGVDRVGIHDNFFALGGDSILSIQVVARAAQRGIRITSRALFQHPTIAGLATVAEGMRDTKGELVVDGPVRLTPIQRWFFELGSPEPSHYNQALMLEAQGLDARALGEALTALVNHHDALRTRFFETDEGRVQEVMPPALRVEVASTKLEADDGAALSAAATSIQRSLDIERGRVFGAAVFTRADKPSLVLLAIHHLVVDGVSWRILLEDLERAYALAQAGRPVTLPPKTVSFAAWASELGRYATSERLLAEVPYWRDVVRAPAGDIDIELDAAPCTEEGAEIVSVALSSDRTLRLLQQVPRAYGTQINDVLLAALAEALGEHVGSDVVRIALEGHGREEDAVGSGSVARTVGWYTSLFPVVLTRAADVVSTLKQTKDRLRAIPHRGVGYGILRYVTGASELAMPAPRVVFNYLGQLDARVADAAFVVSSETPGQLHSSRTPMAHALSVNASVQEGKLAIEWLYAASQLRRATVERLAARFVAALDELITHCTAEGAGGYTASDFPLAGLTSDALDALVARHGVTQRGSVDDVFPLSPMQEGMLFHTLYAPEAGAYFEQLEVGLRGDVDGHALGQALNDVVAVHSALRAAFAWEGLTRPLQIVHAHVEVPFEQHDFTHHVASKQRAELDALRARRKREGFDITRAPLLRADLVRTDDGYVLLVCFHHLLMDGWSVASVFAELFRSYGARVRGDAYTRPAALPFRAYIAWLEAQERGAAEAFWKKTLAGFHHATPVWGDKAPRRLPSPTNRHAVLDRHVRRATTEKLERLGRAHGLTLATLVQGAWALLLSRYSGETDVLFGAVTSGRPGDLEGIESAVGLFINTVPVRVHVDAACPALRWLTQLQSQNLEMRAYEHAPLARVQAWSDVASGEPLFESLFVFENYPVDDAARQADALIAVTDVRAWETTNYPLNVIVGPGKEVLLRLNYDTSRFDDATIVKMAGHLEALLESLAEAPESPIGRLTMVTRQERELVTVAWNRTSLELPLTRALHEVFEDHATATPDALAVVHDGASLSYGALDDKANQLAHALRAAGVRPDTIVALFIDKSVDAIVGILAILKAGGAYLPLDPDYPAERIAFMLEDSGSGIVVTNERLSERAALLPAKKVILDASVERLPTKRPMVAVRPGDLAYVIYTSGSTGRPKGAMLTHGGLTNLATHQIGVLGVGAASRVLQFASLSFDASVWEMAMAFAAGASLHIASREQIFAEGGLRKLLLSQAIDTALLPPSVLPTLDPSELVSLRTLLVGGESCPPALAARWAEGRNLWNAYGPTEATVYSAIAECKNGILPPIIGRPIANTQLYVCDANLEPVPVGVPGELLIGGVGVARGYLNRPELTEERFVVDRFGSDPDARLYRTGDLVRFLPDGNLEYLGRIDDQVKIRGYRIELGEIEAALATHTAVREGVVVARADEGGDKRLVAYVIGAGEGEPTASELREHLARTLPAHMLPAAFVVCAEFPRTPNGKVDRNRLPAPFGGATDTARPYVAPSTSDEHALAEAWKEVLRLERVSVHDDFFELGGDSILSIQIVTRAAKRGVRVSAHDVFTHRTIAKLASSRRRSDETRAAQGEIVGPAELLPIQTWFLEGSGKSKSHFNMSLFLRTMRAIDVDALKSALRAIVGHHDALRTRFWRDAAGWHQELAPAGTEIGVELVSLSGDAPDEMQSHATRMHASLDIESGPLLRCAVFTRPSEAGAYVLVAIHHLVVDAVSLRLIREDLETAYAQVRAGEPIVLPAKTTSFQAWGAQLHALGHATRLSSQYDYWHRIVTSPACQLPVDNPLGDSTSRTAETLSFSLSVEETRSLLREVPKAYRTQVNDALMTALVEALGAWTGDRAFRIDLEGHGREEEVADDVDLTRTVGWFTTMFPVLLERQAGGIAATLIDVKERLRAVPDRGIGYGVLTAMGGHAELVPSSPTALSFNYLGQLSSVADDGNTFELVSAPAGKTASDDSPRRHALTINALVVDGVLTVHVTYGSEQYGRATVEALGNGVLSGLRAIIVHCATEGVGGLTSSDVALARLGQSELDSLTQRLGLRPSAVEDIYPLSPMQEALAFHAIYAPGSSAYSSAYYEQTCLTLDGDVNAEALRGAWQDVVDAHAILRTSFAWDGLARPLQIVHARVSVPFDLHDWTGKDATIELETLAAERRRAGFDLTKVPALRIDLARVGEREYRLLVAFHHVLLDGWSAARVFAAVFDAYAARISGSTWSPEPATPFRAYIEWLERGDRAREQEFWTRELQGFESATPLWGDRAPKKRADETTKHGELSRTVGAATASALSELARSRGLTLNTVLQGVWALLLRVYSGERDVVFGIVTSGRPSELSGVDTSVGLFINTIPLRVHVDGTKSVVAWLSELQAKNLELRQHEHASLAQVQSWSEVPSGEPLFESVLVFESYPITASVDRKDAPLSVRDLRGWNRADLPIHVNVFPGRELGLQVDYDTTRFDEARIAKMLAHFERALEEIVTDPERALGALSVLTEREREQVIVEWNATSVPFPNDRSLSQLFEEQVARTPAADAVVYKSSTLSYAELNARANQLARHLRKVGVGPEVRVGIGTSRTPSLIVGILAVLKAGGAYVPLDPNYPTERLAYMAEDAELAVLLTEERVAAAFATVSAPRVLLDADWATIALEPSSDLGVSASPHNLAYVIYTSGSTGRPKGVAVPHLGVVNMVTYERQYYGMGPKTRMLQFASVSFDNSVEEIFDTLLTGGALVLAPPEVMGVGAELNAFLREQRVTTISLAPAALAALPDDDLPDLTTVIVGGEACPPELARRWGRGRTFINSYGPTETTVAATLWKYVPDEAVAIGEPLANTFAYVLDSELRPVPVGVAGELYIGGVGVTRGYVNDPRRTAEKFFADPFAFEPGARMYATGDLVRWRDGGTLEYLGRVDHQVKIRGFRIELGEIEAALSAAPAVQNCVVVVREDVPGDRQLVAYVCGHDGIRPKAAELRELLKARLPAYMVPSQIEVLDALPLNTSGKIDRRALPPPGATPRDSERTHVAPRSADERAVAAIFQRVLRIEEEISVHDDFFALGGHSLLAVVLVTRLEAEFGRRLPIQAVFEDATIEGLAKRLRESDRATARLVELRRAGTRTPLFLVHPVGGSVFCYRALAEHLGADQPVYALQSAHFAGGEGQKTIEDMARAYIADMKRVQPQGPYRIGGWSMGGVIAWEMARQLEESGETTDRLVLLDAHAPELVPIDEPSPDKVRVAFEDYMRTNAGDAEWNERASEEVWPAFRDNLIASLRYRPEPSQKPMLVLRASNSPVRLRIEPWTVLAGDRVEVVDVDADHWTIVTDGVAKGVAQTIARYLEGASFVRSEST